MVAVCKRHGASTPAVQPFTSARSCCSTPAMAAVRCCWLARLGCSATLPLLPLLWKTSENSSSLCAKLQALESKSQVSESSIHRHSDCLFFLLCLLHPKPTHPGLRQPTVRPPTVRSRNSPAAAAAAPLLQKCTQCRRLGMRGAKLPGWMGADRGGGGGAAPTASGAVAVPTAAAAAAGRA